MTAATTVPRMRLTPIVAAILALGALATRELVTPLSADGPTETINGHEAIAGEVLVAFRQAPDVERLRLDLDADIAAPAGGGHVWRTHSRSRSARALIAQLARRPDVRYVEPNYIVSMVREPNDPRFPELWGLENIGQPAGGIPGTPGADIHAAAAWDRAIGARTVVVGVVDTGIDYTHPDLAANAWSAPSPFTVAVGGQTITCAAGTHGFNAITKTCDPLDDHFHGTHVSGTIGAAGNNATGVAGVNWIANIMGLKFLGSTGSGNLGDAINAIEFGIQAKQVFGAAANVRVLSNSWAGGPFSQALFDEITRANQNDILFVAAAGNSTSNNDSAPTYPASYAIPNVIAVAATDNQDAIATFSNFGANSVHLGAPGVKVLSTVPGRSYDTFSGTSMATPHVSGSAALLLSRCPMTTSQVKALLLSSVDPIPALAGLTITGGRLNVGAAMAACGRPSNIAPTIVLSDPTVETTIAAPGPIVLRATASDPDGTIQQVAFFAGTSLIGSVSNTPFDFTWSNARVGNYAVNAVAIDNEGAASTSAPITVHVLPGPASQPFGGAAALIPGIVEAENFNEGGEGVGYHDTTSGNAGGAYRTTDVDIQPTTDTTGGFALGFVDGGEWLAYSVFVSASAQYTLDTRLASNGPGGTFHIEMDGIDVTGPMVAPNTGGWQVWQSLTVTGIPLTAGLHMMRVVIDTKGTTGFFGNLNYMRWTIPGVNTPPTVTLTSPSNGGTYVAPATIPLAAAASDIDGTIAQVNFLAGTSLIATDTAPPYTTSWTGVPAGSYTLTAVATDNAGASTTSNAITITVVDPPPPTPFGGSPAVIPGVVEAENFDNGGEGIAYHDTTAGNAGGAYRQTDVDIQPTLDTGGGYSLGWVVAGEWLKYSVSVTTSATYTLDARVAASGAGGTLHVEIDGANVTGNITVPNSGGWQTWRTVSIANILMSAGPHMMRVSFDTNGDSGFVANVNSFKWSIPASIPPSTPFGGTAAAIPGRIEAENFDDGGEGVAYHDTTAGNTGGQYRQTDVDIEATADIGGGYSVGWVTAGEWLQYSTVVTTASTYSLEVRFASAVQGGSFHVEVDSRDVTGPLTVVNTGGWQTWGSTTVNGIPLTAGPHVVRLAFDNAAPGGFVANINYMRWSVATGGGGSSPFGGTAWSIPGLIEAENFDDGGEGVAYHDTTAGNAGGKYRSTDVDIETTADTGGGYSIGYVVAGEWLKYSTTVGSSGTFALELRVASNGAGGTCHVEVDGTNVTGAITVPNTSGWQTWQSVTVSGIALTAGPHSVRLAFDTNGSTGFVGNVNYLRWR